MRTTDLAVHRRTGLTPLSVSTDRIAHPAFRWAGIEAGLREMGIDVARDGSGRVCEVYPAATLKCWSLPYRGYKGTKNLRLRSELVAALVERLPWLDWNGHQEACAADDNALDAVLAALTAREVALGCVGPPPDLRTIARREGWIWLPSHGEGPRQVLARLEREGRYVPPASRPAPWPSSPTGRVYTDTEVEALLDEMRGEHATTPR